jgi:hypothetical protein
VKTKNNIYLVLLGLTLLAVFFWGRRTFFWEEGHEKRGDVLASPPPSLLEKKMRIKKEETKAQGDNLRKSLDEPVSSKPDKIQKKSEVFLIAEVRASGRKGRPLEGVRLEGWDERKKKHLVLGVSDEKGVIRCTLSGPKSRGGDGWKEKVLFFFLSKDGFLPKEVQLRWGNIKKKSSQGKMYHWTLSEGGGVKGRIFAEGKPVVTARVFLFEERLGPSYGLPAWSRQGGAFVACTYERNKTLLLLVFHAKWGCLSREVFIPAHGGVVNLGRLDLSPTGVLEGFLQFPNGEKVVNVGMGVHNVEDDDVFHFYEGGRKPAFHGAPTGFQRTTKDGGFRFLGLYPGTYSVYLRGLFWDALEKRLRDMRIKTGGPPQTLKIPAFLLQVILLDEKGAPFQGFIGGHILREILSPHQKRSYTRGLERHKRLGMREFRISSYYDPPYFFKFGTRWEIRMTSGDLEGKAEFSVPKAGPPFKGEVKIRMKPKPKKTGKGRK